MAKCDEGYLCDVCGKDVGAITESDLYLQFVTGMVDAETLHTTPERHIRCNPALAQFIVDPQFPAVSFEGPLDKRALDPSFVTERESLITRGWQRLKQVAKERPPITEYPLPEVIERARNT